jgi:acetoin utilization deacetylase AcuC-like enzyme
MTPCPPFDLSWDPGYAPPLPPGHSFPMDKYSACIRALDAAGAPWRRIAPDPAGRAWLTTVHAPDYVDAVLAADVPRPIERRIGLPVTPAVARRAQLSAGGTFAAACRALEAGYAATAAGGSHHAMPDGGAGYCVFNDLALAARRLLAEGRVRRLLVIDLDVHQGDGTAVCLAGEPRAFTFSVHAAKNFPVRKAESSRDVPLADGTGDDAYLEVLKAELPALFEAASPDIVLFQGGVDCHEGDRLGRLALSDAGLQARDAMVAAACRARGVPMAATLGGGYGDPEVIGARHARGLMAQAKAALG